MENEPSENLSKAQPEIDLEREMVDEAFLLKPDDALAIEKKILAVAFLLEACTYEGNESLDGAVADGFAVILRDAAGDVARLRKKVRRQDE